MYINGVLANAGKRLAAMSLNTQCALLGEVYA